MGPQPVAALAGQMVGSTAGQTVACFGHWGWWIGQTVTSAVLLAHWVGLFGSGQVVGWLAHWVVVPLHWVVTFGQVVVLTGHSVS